MFMDLNISKLVDEILIISKKIDKFVESFKKNSLEIGMYVVLYSQNSELLKQIWKINLLASNYDIMISLNLINATIAGIKSNLNSLKKES